MCKQVAFLLMLLGLCVSPIVNAANIIYVAENDDQNGDGIIDDIQWPTWFAAQGYPVSVNRNNWLTLDATKIAQLNAADLIIVSRNTDSGDYATNATERNQWNSVTAPMLVLTPYLARASRWNWVNGEGLTILAGSPVWEAVAPTHAVFSGIDLAASKQVSALDGTMAPSIGVAHLANVIGNGILIAQVPGTNEQAIVEWAPGVAFYTGGPTAVARRLMFCTGTSESATTPQGAFNLTPVGEKMLVNTIRYMLGVNFDAASSPNPADKAGDVLRDTLLSWTPGPKAVKHDVYFGVDYDTVSKASRANPSGVLVSKAQDPNTFDPPGVLEFGKTYYWRVDEVHADGVTIDVGAVWSFIVEPTGYPVQNVTATASSFDAGKGPEKTIDGSGLDANDTHSTNNAAMWLSSKTGPTPVWIQYAFDRVYKLNEMWVWNHNTEFESMLGFGFKGVTLQYSVNGTDWTTLGDFEFAQAPSADGYAHNTTIDLGGVAARQVKIIMKSGWGTQGQYGLSEVRFFYIPVFAREPKPASGSTGVDPGVVLSWRAGREAVSHNVYIGTDGNAVKDGTVAPAVVSQASYAPPGLQLGTAYYWKVSEVNMARTPSTWESDVWSFSTPDYVTVDDMEGYNDSTNQIFNVWVDGYGTTTNGSQVGYTTSPFAERTIVRGGRQSMPLAYNNTSVTNSEATRTFEPAQDWTAGGVKTLVVYFRGDPANTTGQLFVKINGTKVNYSGSAAAQTSLVWKQWNIDLTAISGLKAVKTLTIGISGSGKGTLYIDDVRLYKSAPAVIQPVDPGTTNLMAYYAMENDAKDSKGGYNGTLNNVTFADSLAGFGKAAQFNGTTAYVDLGTSFGNLISALSSSTFTVWVNYTGAGTVWQRVFDIGTGTTAYMFLTTRNAGSAPRFAITTSGTAGEAMATASGALSTGWHHAAGVIDASTMRISLYIDGNLAQGNRATTALPKDLGKTTQNWLGRSQYTADPYLNGAIDEFRVFNRALSEGEIRFLAGDR